MNRRRELKCRLLRHLLLYGRATRPELVAMTGVRAATVFGAIDELKAEHILCEPARRGRKTGRRSPELRCDPDCCRTAGVELRRSGCVGVIVDAAGTPLHTCGAAAGSRLSAQEVKLEILEVLQRLRDMAGDGWAAVRGIGFADPGLVDVAGGRSVRAVEIPPWRDVDTGGLLTRAAGLPSGVWSSAEILTRMEYLRRLPDVPESIFDLITGDGIGGGFLRRREFFDGVGGRAAEIAHLPVRPGGVPCRCGGSGCLEAESGVEGLAAKVAGFRASGRDTGGMPETFSIEDFARRAGENGALREIFDGLCRDLGSALSAVVMLLHPEVIVISGAFAALGNMLTDALRRELESRCFPEAVGDLKIETSSPGAFDAAVGAAMMMRDRVLLGGGVTA